MIYCLVSLVVISLVDYVSQLLNGIVGFFLQFMPLSPFADIGLSGVFDVGLGWLNWLVPFGDMVNLFTAWCGACLVAAGGRFVFKRASGLMLAAGAGA